jgi:DNA-binding NtrC family response regulator
MRILFVEDDTSSHASMIRALGAFGLTVVAVATRAEANALIDKGGIDGLIIDLHLGEDDPRGGIRVVEHLRTRSQAPVIVLTGQMAPEAKAAERLGAHYQLKPPLTTRGLADYLREHQPEEVRTRSGVHASTGDAPDRSGTFVEPTLEAVAGALASIEGPTPAKVERLKDLAYADALRAHGGNVTKAAHALGITRQAPQRWLSRARTG